MKTILLTLIFLCLGLGLYFLLALIPLAWDVSYYDIIHHFLFNILAAFASFVIALFATEEIKDKYF